jgi:hypothetical protein
MIKKHPFILFVFSLILFSCHSKARENELQGMWKLVEMSITEDTGKREFLGGMDGYLLYDDRHFGALHLFPEGYDKYDSIFQNFNGEINQKEAQHVAMNYNYMAKYWTNQDTVFHLKLSHSNPTEWGDTSKRIYYFSGDTLILRPVESKNSKLVLKWLKKN